MSSIRELRERAGLTQVELARRSGVAQPNIAAYESGSRVASARMVERLRRAASPLPHDLVAERRLELLALAERFGLSDVRVFGSVARQDDTAASDVDLLVTVSSGTGLLTVSEFALAVEDLLGVSVDVLSAGGLRADHPIRCAAVPV